MSLLAANKMLMRTRRRFVVFAIAVVIVGAVAAHHATPMPDHMGAVVCLAVVGGLSVAAVALATAVWRRPRLDGPAGLRAFSANVSSPRLPPARAGPLKTVVLRL